jgi:hypothetical protein
MSHVARTNRPDPLAPPIPRAKPCILQVRTSVSKISERSPDLRCSLAST